MKRYLVFYGETDHPNGGMKDFVMDYDHLLEAKDCIMGKLQIDGGDYMWGHIYDLQEQKIISDTERKEI